MPKILVVEDDESMADIVEDTLTLAHHVVDRVNNGQAALDFLQAYQYDLIVLDWELPGSLAGPEICEQFRAYGGNTPVLFLTGRSALQDKVRGLDTGAEDYLTKPFDVDEFTARIRSLLRRPYESSANSLSYLGVYLDASARTVTVDGETVSLIPSEFALLEFLMKHPDATFKAEWLWQHTQDMHTKYTEDAIRTCVKNLRKKLKQYGSIITNVYGKGYRLGKA
jgi:DNA-binding response OmpR family regulator